MTNPLRQPFCNELLEATPLPSVLCDLIVDYLVEHHTQMWVPGLLSGVLLCSNCCEFLVKVETDNVCHQCVCGAFIGCILFDGDQFTVEYVKMSAKEFYVMTFSFRC